MTDFLDKVIKAFGHDAKLMTFTETENEVIVKGTHFLEDGLWKELNGMVFREFKGKYSSVMRGWIIPKLDSYAGPPQPTRTGIPKIDKKLEEMEGEKAAVDAMFKPASQIGGEGYGLGEATEKKEGFQMLPLEKITTSPVKVRLSINEAYIAELSESVKGKGVISPILVRRLPSGNFQIVYGEQRYRAAQKAGLKEIPCMVKAMGDREAFETSLTENDQRKDLTDYERAKAYQRMLKTWPEEYPTQSVLAFKLGKSEGWVSQRLKILDLENLYPGKDSGKIFNLTERQARALLSAPLEKRDEILKEIEEGQELPSAREIEAKAKPPEIKPLPCSDCFNDSAKDGGRCFRTRFHVTEDGSALVCEWQNKYLADPWIAQPTLLTVASAPTPTPTPTPILATGITEPVGVPIKKGPYWCKWCNHDKETYQVKDSWDGAQKVCNFCGKPVETIREVVETKKPAISEPEKKGVEAPPLPFPERMRVTVSNAERDVYAYLLKAFEEGRLKARPFLNDDRHYYYCVKPTFPDIGFEGIEVPVYLCGEVHMGKEERDDAVKKALERQNVKFAWFDYVGQLGKGECEAIGEETIKKANIMKEALK